MMGGLFAMLVMALMALPSSGCDAKQAEKNDMAGGGGNGAGTAWPRDGSKEKPLIVMLVPAEAGTEDGTKADFLPIFNAVSRSTGLNFDIKVGQSYAAVVEGAANGLVDIAFYGAVTYMQAHGKGGAELLAVAVEKGESIYFSGVFVANDSGINKATDLKGKKVAVGDPNSTSSFAAPLAMLIAQGLDVTRDIEVQMTGSHSNSLKALTEGHVQAACLSFDVYEKAVGAKSIDPTKFKPLIKSDPIPYPPLAMHPKLPADIKKKLRDGFENVHKAQGITPEMIRGYGGKKVDRYDTTVKHETMANAVKTMSAVTDEVKGEILKKAGKR